MNLSEKFNQQEFINWIEKFLPNFSNDHRKVDIPNGLTGVTSISTLGESALGVRVFIIETEKDPSGRKIGLAKESFNLIKNYGTPNALIAYYSKESSKWRLSLLTSTPEWSDGKIITKLSNPKRQSYVLGEDAKVNTPTRFLLKKDAVTDITDLKSRFSLEVVNKEFYKEISESFIKLVGGTTGTGRNQKKYESLLKLPSVTDHSQTSIEFAVRLIGRIIFCWFLREKKGPDGTSLMPKELLSLEAIEKNPDYYHKVLEPIFFEVLNQPAKSRKDLFYGKPYSLIPYLNGGLFSPHKPDDFYERKNGDLQSRFHNTLIIPDSWFVELFKTLETYNFTIDENTSFDEELSIDPEMLGRIFENLLAEINPETGESARKSTGSYYTPRVIVDYMVDESLLLYLKQQTGVEENKLRAIISYDLTDDNQYPLADSEKQKVIDALEKIKILDPACGSGAFPIGALQKMVFILQQVDPEGQLWFKKQIQHTSPEIRRVLEREFTHKNFDYIRKLGVIRENIYGIDIQPIATEISRLRCFLTLVVDERIDDTLENRGIEPLPNLDFKFVTANSLVALPSSGKQVQFGLFEDSEGISELKEIRDMFFNASGSEREMLKLQFVQSQNKMFQKLINEGLRGHADLTTKLTSWDPFSHKASDWFDPEWMFGIKEGFDVVIANPPYIQIKQIPWEDRKIYKNMFRSAVGRFNIFYFFIEKSSIFTKTEGLASFIVPDRLLLNTQCSELRQWLLNEQQILEIDSFKEEVFEAVVDSILIFFKDIKNSYSSILVKDRVGLEELGITKAKRVPVDYFKNSPSMQFDLSYDEDVSKIIKKIRQNSIELGSISEIKDGIIQGKVADVLFIKHPQDSDSKKLLFGEDINRYVIRFNNNWVNYKPKEMMRLEVERRGPGVRHGLWLRTPEIFERRKLLTRQTADEIIAALDDGNFYYSNTLHGTAITDTNYDPLYILALLNSKLMTWYYRKTTAEEDKVFAQIKIALLRKLPIVSCKDEQQKLFIELVNSILSMTNSNDYLENTDKQSSVKKYKKQIDQKVYELYELTPEEIAIVEGK